MTSPTEVLLTVADREADQPEWTLTQTGLFVKMPDGSLWLVRATKVSRARYNKETRVE